MSEWMVIFILVAFVVPAVCILGDNGNWERKKN
jgi:hypothetical protein